MELIFPSTHFGKCCSDRGFHGKIKEIYLTLILPDVFVLTIFNEEFQDYTDPQFTFGSYRTINNIFISVK